MSSHITSHRGGFAPGFTAITRLDDPANETGIALGVLRLGAGERMRLSTANETAWLLMSGELSAQLPETRFTMRRASLFDDSPACVHVPAGTEVGFESTTESELTVYSVGNRAPRTISS